MIPPAPAPATNHARNEKAVDTRKRVSGRCACDRVKTGLFAPSENHDPPQKSALMTFLRDEETSATPNKKCRCSHLTGTRAGSMITSTIWGCARANTPVMGPCGVQKKSLPGVSLFSRRSTTCAFDNPAPRCAPFSFHTTRPGSLRPPFRTRQSLVRRSTLRRACYLARDRPTVARTLAR